MHKLVITFLSISQIVKAGKLQQKARQGGQYRLKNCALIDNKCLTLNDREVQRIQRLTYKFHFKIRVIFKFFIKICVNLSTAMELSILQ